MVVAVVGLGCQLPVTRLWKQCFFEIAQFAQLGTGNFLCHCEHGYHRGPIAGGLVYCALHNSQPDRDAPVGMLWFLDELAKVQKTNTQNIKHKQNNLTKIKRSARSRMSARSVIFAPTPPRIAVWPACNVGLTSQSPRSLPSTLTSRALIPPTPLRLSARSIEGGGGGVDMRLSARSIAGGEGGGDSAASQTDEPRDRRKRSKSNKIHRRGTSGGGSGGEGGSASASASVSLNLDSPGGARLTTAAQPWDGRTKQTHIYNKNHNTNFTMLLNLFIGRCSLRWQLSASPHRSRRVWMWRIRRLRRNVLVPSRSNGLGLIRRRHRGPRVAVRRCNLRLRLSASLRRPLLRLPARSLRRPRGCPA